MQGIPWGSIKLEYYPGTTNIRYIGKNKEVGADEGHKSWYIQKGIYDSSNKIIELIGPKLGQWSARETLLP